MPRGGLVWRSDTLTPKMLVFSIAMEEAIWRILQQLAPDIQDWMKGEAVWTDRTGEAREGLTATPFRDFTKMGIAVYHTADHGIWLEVAHGGVYAIIQPTVDQWGPEVIAAIGASALGFAAARRALGG